LTSAHICGAGVFLNVCEKHLLTKSTCYDKLWIIKGRTIKTLKIKLLNMKNNEKELINEMSIHTPEYKKIDSIDDDLSSKYISLFLVAWDEYIKGHLSSAFSSVELLRDKAIKDRELLLDHDCHLSQDSGCQTCEDIMEYNFIINKCEDLMESIDKQCNE